MQRPLHSPRQERAKGACLQSPGYEEGAAKSSGSSCCVFKVTAILFPADSAKALGKKYTDTNALFCGLQEDTICPEGLSRRQAPDAVRLMHQISFCHPH